MICVRMGLIRLIDLYYDEKAWLPPADVLRYNQWSRPVPDCRSNEFHTILIDLNQPEERLFSGLSKGMQYKIRRASASDALSYLYRRTPEAADVVAFCNFFDSFAAQKRLPRARRGKLLAMARGGALSLSGVRRDSEDLVWHAYLMVGARARLLHSASLYRGSEDTGRRNMIGRANRFHHWQDIVQFRRDGISLLDLGGWYAGNRDSDLLNINRFKEEFGGKIVRSFNCARGLTIRGRIALRLRSALPF